MSELEKVKPWGYKRKLIGMGVQGNYLLIKWCRTEGIPYWSECVYPYKEWFEKWDFGSNKKALEAYESFLATDKGKKIWSEIKE